MMAMMELVEDDAVVLAPAEFDDQAHALAVGLVADVGDAADGAVLDAGGDPLDDPRLDLAVRDLRDDDLALAAARFLGVGAGPHRDGAPAGGVALLDAAPAADEPTGGEVRSLDDLHQVLDRDVRVVDDGDGGVADFGQVVGRDAGGHPHRDAAGPVAQQVRHLARQDGRLGARVVVVGLEVDRVLLQVLEHLGRHLGEARFGVPHGGGRVAVDRPEVALAIHQGIPLGERLGHPHQRGVHDGLAVRMVVAGGVAGDLGALAKPAAGAETEVVHRHQNPPLAGLQAVPHVGQGAADDDAHGVRQVRVLHLLFDKEFLDVLRLVESGHLGGVLPFRASP